MLVHMNKRLIIASTGAAALAVAGFGSIALAQDDAPSTPAGEYISGPVGELDSPPADAGTGEGETLFEDEAGTFSVQCTADGPEILWWTTGEGYIVDDVDVRPDDDDDGDDRDVEIEFTNGEREVEYEVVCVDGLPRADIEIDHDDDWDDHNHDDHHDRHDDDWDDHDHDDHHDDD